MPLPVKVAVFLFVTKVHLICTLSPRKRVVFGIFV